MPVTAVIQAHYALDNRDIRILTGACERFEQLRITQHPGVQVAARATGGLLVIARIDVVRPALERLDDESQLPQRRDQTGRDRSLTDVRGGSCNDDARYGSRVFEWSACQVRTR